MTTAHEPADHNEKEWMGILEVAELFEVSRNTATKLLTEHKVRCLHLLNKRRYDRQQVKALYAASIINGDD